MTYNLPHPLDRPYQQEALDWIMASGKKYNIICAPTGSGKSAWVAGASQKTDVMVLTKTKSLQSENYDNTYGCDPLYGKGNYPCDSPDNPSDWTAYDCGTMKCQCKYQMQYRHCKFASWRVSLNYAKYLSSNISKSILFLDEAHNMPDIVTEYIGLTLRWDNEFIQYRNPPKAEKTLTYPEAMAYFKNCARYIKSARPNKKNLMQWRKWKRLYSKIETINKIITQSESLTDWYYEADEEKLLIKPLTAKYHFKKLFNAPKIVLMSATINPSIINRLGIDENEMAFLEIPNIWAVPTRLIHDLNAPPINWKSPKKDRQKQIELIASILRSDKSSIIHVMSNAQAWTLKNELYQMGIHSWIPEKGIGTDKQLSKWNAIRKPGLNCISFTFHEGVDLGEEDICITAKIPWGDIGPNYERARMNYDKKWYNERSSYLFMQSYGRTQRGKKEHYTGEKKAYIADGSWTRLNYLSDDFKKRIRHYGKHI